MITLWTVVTAGAAALTDASKDDSKNYQEGQMDLILEQAASFRTS